MSPLQFVTTVLLKYTKEYTQKHYAIDIMESVLYNNLLKIGIDCKMK